MSKKATLCSALLVGMALCVLACGSKDRPASRLNDTGIHWSGNYPKGNNQGCVSPLNSLDDALDIFSFQDCRHGFDSATQSKDSTFGFQYLKVDRLGKRLPSDSTTSWYCVLDTITGLLWERKQPSDGILANQGLQDSDDLFTWYNSRPTKNGGAVGEWNNDVAQCTGYIKGQPTSYCNVEEFKNRVNRQALCGFSDWRIPTKPELESLVNYGRTQPAIDTHFFGSTKNQFYWSDSPSAQSQLTAWAVNFQFGYSAAVPRDNARHVRLVRTWEPVD